jgi:hypothetical protein
MVNSAVHILDYEDGDLELEKILNKNNVASKAGLIEP